MYCKRCGKFIDYQADICNECAQADSAQVQQEQPQAPVAAGSMTTGLGKSITSVILGTVGQFFAGIATGIMSDAYTVSGAIVVLLMIAIGLSIPSLIMGIGSIKTFLTEKNEGRIKPIPTLIVGIYGLATAAIGLMISGIMFLVVIAGAM